MKELSIENKAKRYDKALEVAKRKLCFDKAGLEDSYTPNDLYEIFPELKESEDEEVRKALIDYFDDANKADENPLQSYGIYTDKAIAWLEKQGKSESESLEEMVDNTNEVEPKFDEGDWVILTEGELSSTLQIANVDINKERYWFNDGSYLLFADEGCLHKWTIADAKAGDVLDANGAPFIYKKHDKDSVYFYCGVNLADEFIVANGNDTWNINRIVYPATNEQCVLLFSKMLESGYAWNERKLELKKITSDNAEQDRLPFIWHDAAKELPPNRKGFDVSEYVLVYDQFGSVYKSAYDYGNKCWMYNNYNVTHWAYLPEPPKTE